MTGLIGLGSTGSTALGLDDSRIALSLISMIRGILAIVVYDAIAGSIALTFPLTPSSI
jgi:hypothetical protein